MELPPASFPKAWIRSAIHICDPFQADFEGDLDEILKRFERDSRVNWASSMCNGLPREIQTDSEGFKSHLALPRGEIRLDISGIITLASCAN